MRFRFKKGFFTVWVGLAGVFGYCQGSLWGQSNLDIMGVTELRSVAPDLIGTGVSVGQVESASTNTGYDYEASPSSVQQSNGIFTYRSALGSKNGFPNSVGTESNHADQVAVAFYGNGDTADSAGVAPGVSHIYNDQDVYYYPEVVARRSATAMQVVNQSFADIETGTIDQDYDNYAADHNTLFVSGVGDGDGIYAPATCYNGIGVAAYGEGAGSSVGPTNDGRSKPDITAPASETSFSTPEVSGVAAVLIQATHHVSNGGNARDIRTLKALLLNGAVKPDGWTHTATAPLDTRYGAGIVNAYNSYVNLQGGKKTPGNTSKVALGDPHPPPASRITIISGTAGWDYRGISSSSTQDCTSHYMLEISATSDFTGTLVWERQDKRSGINNLDLYLYRSDGTLIASSVSTIDNVQHLWAQDLPPGEYDLQVLKRGGKAGTAPGVVTNSENYGLAYRFVAD